MTKNYVKNKDLFVEIHSQSVINYLMTKSYVKTKNVFIEEHN